LRVDSAFVTWPNAVCEETLRNIIWDNSTRIPGASNDALPFQDAPARRSLAIKGGDICHMYKSRPAGNQNRNGSKRQCSHEIAVPMSQIYDVRCYMYADDLETAIEPLHRAQWAKAKLGSRTVFSVAYFTTPRAQIRRGRYHDFGN
jgi:hypothetical protein